MGTDDLSDFKQHASFEPARLQELADLGGAAMVQSVVQVFDGAVGAQLDDVIGALVAQDREALKGSAHRLKGSAGTVGAWRLSKICQYLEDTAASGNVPDGLLKCGGRPSADYLRECLADAQTAMRAWATTLASDD